MPPGDVRVAWPPLTVSLCSRVNCGSKAMQSVPLRKSRASQNVALKSCAEATAGRRLSSMPEMTRLVVIRVSLSPIEL